MVNPMTKKTMADLALFGGNPAFHEVLHVGRPNIGNRQRLLERIKDILDSRWLTNNGPYVREFEHRLEEHLGVKHCIAMCNATVALEIVARALGLTGEVIVPAFTFIATAHALQWQQITPVFGDVEPHTHNLDPMQVERMITPRTTGILGVHLWGQPCDVEALTEIAQRHRLRLLFDAAHAFGCSYKGRMIGNLGDAEVFSFHATKFFNTFEGGAVTTNNDDLAQQIRLMHNFGFAGMDKVIYIGTNGKMSEVAAAMGLTGIEDLEQFVTHNRRNYFHYHQELRDLPGLRLLTYDETQQGNYQYIVAEVDKQLAGLSRDDLVRVLHAEHVRARRYFYPGCHRMEPYRSFFPHAHLLLPQTEKLIHSVLTLPTGMAVSSNDVEMVCEIVRLAIAHGAEISSALDKEGRKELV